MEQEDNKLYMNGQEVVLKNPGMNGLADFLILAKAMSKMPKTKTKEEEEELGSKFMQYLDEKAIESVVKLINLTMKKTFGNVTEEIDAWAMENAMVILPKVIEMCSPKNASHEVKKKEELMQRLQQ